MNQLMTAEADDDSTPVCRVVGAGAQFTGKSLHLYAPGISAQSIGARGISLQIAAIPKIHKHGSHGARSIFSVATPTSGTARNSNAISSPHAGDFVYVPAGISHLPYNLSDDDYCVALVARTDPNDQESVVLLPGLDREHRNGASQGCWTACAPRPAFSPGCHRIAQAPDRTLLLADRWNGPRPETAAT